jgi:hypothetical protein
VKREDELIDAMPLFAFAKTALGRVEGTVLSRHYIETRRTFVGIPEASHPDRRLRAVLGQAAMDPIEVRGVEIAFEVLQPVRLFHHDVGLADEVRRQRIDLKSGK